MSDGEDHAPEHESSAKKRRLRACHQCRKKKVRCGGLQDETKACLTCVLAGETCTFPPSNDSRRRRYVDVDYIEALEAKVSMLQLLVQQLREQLAAKDKSSVVTTPEDTSSILSVLPEPRHSPPASDTSSSQDEGTDEGLLEGFKFMSISDTQHVRFLGRSSDFPLVKAVIILKHELIKNSDCTISGVNDDAMLISYRRPQFWHRFIDFIPPDPPYTDFPEPTLMLELLDSYFRTINVDFPLLHRPTFLQSLAAGQHLVDEAFGAIVLLVCAISARYSSNPALIPPGATTWQLAGWRWFAQVREVHKLVPLKTTTLADLQVITLAAAYMGTVTFPITNYAIVSHGLRLAQDLGAHRRSTYSATPTVEDELRKRAFWCLIAMDRTMCAVLGRPVSIPDEEFDLDYPVECDDENWVLDGSKLMFKQPLGQRSTIAHFNLYLKLTQIRSRAMRDLYSLQATSDLQDPERAQQIVAQLDSDLNDWEASIPAFLKFDAHREDVPFAAQAASLCASYHALRIFIHRPFITSGRTTPPPFPSRTICTSAARSCIFVLDRHVALAGPAQIYQYHVAHLFQSSIILLLNGWQSVRTGAISDVVREFEHVRRALRVFRVLEQHFDCTGRFWDMINDLLLTIESRMGSGALDPPEHDGLSRACANARHAEQLTAVAPSQLYTGSELPDGMSLAPGVPNAPLAPAPWQLAAPAGASANLQSADPDLDAIFSDLLPSFAYGDLFASGPQGQFPSEFVFDGLPAGSQFPVNGFADSSFGGVHM
ncbi:Zn(II)2Cys6 transcription factor [Phanerochaete sordida]|uniref:Zn(II)2Cys6 transcription factor n=1 Tax=Phanerochaete sordida TaxID=48140 RepID=A0A9P3G5V3_9APHY|nr:Zn(II)2Cys6 transcription factor [Phanerochaete sordida]